jgi:L-fuconolactonase
VQAVHTLEETRWLLEVAAREPRIAGVVGWVDLTDPDVAATLASLRAGPGGEFLVGIRHQVHDEPDPGWLLREDVLAGLGAVADAGLAYDLLLRPREMPAAIEAVARLPRLRFVVDHLAKPEIAAGTVEPWRRLLAALARYRNVYCKISGLITEASWTEWTTGQLRPYIADALEVFGSNRLLFGSDWPVCLLAGSYSDVVAAAMSSLDMLTEQERAGVFGGNASRAYLLSA